VENEWPSGKLLLAQLLFTFIWNAPFH